MGIELGQLIGQDVFCGLDVGEVPADEAVSYTHLDVYKRQGEVECGVAGVVVKLDGHARQVTGNGRPPPRADGDEVVAAKVAHAGAERDVDVGVVDRGRVRRRVPLPQRAHLGQRGVDAQVVVVKAVAAQHWRQCVELVSVIEGGRPDDEW